MEQTIPCAACSAPVGAEEVAQGLAVRVSGRLLCPLCLDHLPGDAKVLVNQMRALRGMATTTFRFYSGRHPRLPLFTFTTANLVLAHRRKLAHGEVFAAPPLPPPGSRPRLPTAAEAARGEHSGWITVAGVVALVCTGIIWLVLPGGKPPVPRPQAPAPPVAVPSAPLQAEPPARSPASELTTLERSLDAHPGEAQAIAEAAELLRDGLAPREIALRNRANSLVRKALVVVESQSPPPPPPPTPQLPTPTPEPQTSRPAPPPPILPPAQALVVPAPAPPPAVEPVQPARLVKPAKPVKPVKPVEAAACEVVVVWPKSRPLLPPHGLPSGEVPWPWPTGEAIHAAAHDSRLKPRRLAIELRLAGVSAAGGATVVVHPGKAERRQINASWTDGTTTVGPLTIELSGLRWQAIAIPAEGSEAIQAAMRLRLEDVRELGDQRPFLVAGASTRSAGAPTPADHQPNLPLLLPPALETADGWSTFRSALRKLAGRLLDDRQFAFAKAKVLLPFKDQGGKFRSALREDLAGLQRIDRLANGNPDDLPASHPDFLNPQAGWPADGMGDLDRHPVLAFGWRASAWGPDEDRSRRLEVLLGKMLKAETKPRRAAVLPVLVLGEIDSASADESAAIDRRWLDHALRFAALGVPVIDLRPAQAEASTEQVQRAAAALLVDGLRQLDWLVKR